MFVNISGNKFKSKSWITLDLQKSISAKNRLLNNLMKKSKQAYFDKHFERNWNNIKNTWKGIKFLISLKTSIQYTKCARS